MEYCIVCGGIFYDETLIAYFGGVCSSCFNDELASRIQGFDRDMVKKVWEVD